METNCQNFSFFMFLVGMFTLWCYYPWASKENEERCERVMKRVDTLIDNTLFKIAIISGMIGSLVVGYVHSMYLS